MRQPTVGGNGGNSPTDAAFAALSDPYRRAIVASLLRREAAVVDDGELVDQLVDRVEGIDDRNRAVTELRHVHLPKLDAVGVLEYDPRDNVVRADRDVLVDHLERAEATIDRLHPDRADD